MYVLNQTSLNKGRFTVKSLNSATANSVNKTAQPKVALIAEGGGQRGIFTAGVLDAWLEQEYDPFDLFIGTSAGSQNLTSYLARQKGYAKRLIRGLSRNKRFFQLGRGLVGKHIVDLDWYFDKTTEVNRAIDFKTAKTSLGDRELLITATNARDRKAYFLSPTGESQQWRELLKASSALPFLYKQGVKLIALRCAGFNGVDIRKAAELGITVLRVPAYSPHGVAEHAVALMLALNRKIHRSHNRVRA